MVTRALAVAAVSVLLLTGCVTAKEVPKPGLSDAEVDVYINLQLDSMWNGSDLPEDQRPDSGDVQLVQLEEYGDAYASCMNKRGYLDYAGEGEGFAGGDPGSAGFGDEELAANMRCSGLVQLDPSSYALNDAQADFLYDYFQSSLIPCLELAGYHVPGPMPTRAEAWQGWFNPYFSFPGTFSQEMTADTPLSQRCPPVPHGFQFQGVDY